MTGVFCNNTKFQIARVPTTDEYSVLSINVNKQCGLILGLYACALIELWHEIWYNGLIFMFSPRIFKVNHFYFPTNALDCIKLRRLKSA